MGNVFLGSVSGMSIYLELTSAHLAHKNETLSILLTSNSCEKDLVFRNANLRKSADYTKGSAFPIRISRGSIKASFYRLTNILLCFCSANGSNSTFIKYFCKPPLLCVSLIWLMYFEAFVLIRQEYMIN